MKYLKQAAELNCPEAFVMFGDIYRDGLFGQKKDLNTAMEYYERALYSPFTEKKAASILADY